MSRDLISSLPSVKISELSPFKTLGLADGGVIQIKQSCTINFTYKETSYFHEFLIFPYVNATKLIFGWDVMTKLGIGLNDGAQPLELMEAPSDTINGIAILRPNFLK